jgi:hypothetical protein
MDACLPEAGAGQKNFGSGPSKMLPAPPAPGSGTLMQQTIFIWGGKGPWGPEH